MTSQITTSEQVGRRVLYVEDDLSHQQDVRRDLGDLGFTVEAVSTGEAALQRCDSRNAPDSDPDVCLLDLDLSGGGGVQQGTDVLAALAQRAPDRVIPVIVLTSNRSYRTMLELNRAYGRSRGRPGVLYDYAIKSYRGREASNRVAPSSARHLLALAIERVLATRRGDSNVSPALVGVSDANVEAYKAIRAYALAGIPDWSPSVLVTGETGTGKDVAARLLHTRSPRAAGPFVAVNCAALPESLFESELFGYVMGSHSIAHKNTPGLVQAADGGTLFLDEIGEMPLDLQAKLLRVVESRQVRRVGSNETEDIDVRFVTATNRDLRDEVRSGRFREDLLFRLSTLELSMPPLRERLQDIAPLFRTFLRERSFACPRLKEVENHNEIERLLEAYPFPGNVRELAAIVDRAMVSAMARGEGNDMSLRVDDIQWALSRPRTTKGRDVLQSTARTAIERLGDEILDDIVRSGHPRHPKEIEREFPHLSLAWQVLKAVERRNHASGVNRSSPTREECRAWFGWDSVQAFRQALDRRQASDD